MKPNHVRLLRLAHFILYCSVASPALSQDPQAAAASTTTQSNGSGLGEAAEAAPPGYRIGPEDVLAIIFWREKDMSGDVAVRPDGRITLPLLNDIQAAGLTTDELRASITEAANKYFEGPTVTVVVKTINSRKVFITGQVAKQGVFQLTSPTTVVQLITMAGGLLEYADEKNISIVRNENGKVVSFRFNYNDVKKRKNLQQNIELKPGDQVIVP